MQSLYLVFKCFTWNFSCIELSRKVGVEKFWIFFFPLTPTSPPFQKKKNLLQFSCRCSIPSRRLLSNFLVFACINVILNFYLSPIFDDSFPYETWKKETEIYANTFLPLTECLFPPHCNPRWVTSFWFG